MNGSQFLKWGFYTWLGYVVLKELNQPSNNVNYDYSDTTQTPQSGTSLLTPEEIDTIAKHIKEA